MIHAAQCRAAKALFDWSQGHLAAAANVSRNTIIDFEKERRVPRANYLLAIERALTQAGVVFIDNWHENMGPGVLLGEKAACSRGSQTRQQEDVSLFGRSRT